MCCLIFLFLRKFEKCDFGAFYGPLLATIVLVQLNCVDRSFSELWKFKTSQMFFLVHLPRLGVSRASKTADESDKKRTASWNLDIDGGNVRRGWKQNEDMYSEQVKKRSKKRGHLRSVSKATACTGLG